MTPDAVQIRRQQAGDQASARAVHLAAFGRSDEADLVERLRAERAILAAFVAERDGLAVGHVVFSRTLIETAEQSVPAVAIAPLAVLPTHQRQGVGTALVRAGLHWLRTRGEQCVLVVGDPHYYERFGFSRPRAHALRSPFPSDAFLACELVSGTLDTLRGTVQYPAAFGPGARSDVAPG